MQDWRKITRNIVKSKVKYSNSKDKLQLRIYYESLIVGNFLITNNLAACKDVLAKF